MQEKILIIALIVILGLFINILLNRSSYNKSSRYRIAGTIVFLFAGILSSFFVVNSWSFIRFSYLIYFLIFISICLISLYIFSLIIMKKVTDIKQTDHVNANIDKYGYILRRPVAVNPISSSSNVANMTGNIKTVDIENENLTNTINTKAELHNREPVFTILNKEIKQTEFKQTEQVLELQEDNSTPIEQITETQENISEYKEHQADYDVNTVTKVVNDDPDITIIVDESNSNIPEQTEQVFELQDNNIKHVELMIETQEDEAEYDEPLNADLMMDIQNDVLDTTIIIDESNTNEPEQTGQVFEIQDNIIEHVEMMFQEDKTDPLITDSMIDIQKESLDATIIVDESNTNVPEQTEQVFDMQDNIIEHVEEITDMQDDKAGHDELLIEDTMLNIQNDDLDTTVIVDELDTSEPEQSEQIVQDSIIEHIEERVVIQEDKAEYDEPLITESKTDIQNDYLDTTIIFDESQNNEPEQTAQVPELHEDNFVQIEQTAEIQDVNTVYMEPQIDYNVNADSKTDKLDDDLVTADDSRINEHEHKEQDHIQSKQEVIISNAIALMKENRYLFAIQLLSSLSNYNEDISINIKTDFNLIKCFIALKEYSKAQKRLFEFLSQNYDISTEEKSELKEIMILLKDMNR